jgi:hypothetical protein
MLNPDSVLAAAGVSPDRASEHERSIASRICCVLPQGPERERAILLLRRVCTPADFGDAFGAACALEALVTRAPQPN